MIGMLTRCTLDVITSSLPVSRTRVCTCSFLCSNSQTFCGPDLASGHLLEIRHSMGSSTLSMTHPIGVDPSGLTSTSSCWGVFTNTPSASQKSESKSVCVNILQNRNLRGSLVSSQNVSYLGGWMDGVAIPYVLFSLNHIARDRIPFTDL